MSNNATTHMIDYNAVEAWCKAVSPSTPSAFPAAVYEHVNVLQFAQRHNVWFTPDRDSNTMDIIHNERLENFRLACLYDATSNLLDIGVNLDDDVKDTIEWIRLLTQHAGTGERSNLMWLFNGDTSSVAYRTLRL